MKKKTASELMELANQLQEKAAAKERDYSAAIMNGTAGDQLLQEAVKLRVEADATLRAAEEAKKLEAAEAEKARLDEIRQALIKHEGFKTKADQKKVEAVKTLIAGVTLLIEAGQLATAADNVKNQYTLAVPPTRGRILSVYQSGLLNLYVMLNHLKGSLTSEELQLLDALDKFK